MPSDADAARATRRVQALSAHVEGGAAAAASKGAPDPRVRLAPGGGPGSLTVVDNRTGSRYEVPVREGGYVSASAFKAIKAGGDGGGRVVTRCLAAMAFLRGKGAEDADVGALSDPRLFPTWTPSPLSVSHSGARFCGYDASLTLLSNCQSACPPIGRMLARAYQV